VKEREYSVAEARDKLPALVHQAERGRPVRITRRGKRAAVLISEGEYRRSRRSVGGTLGDAILAWRTRFGGVELTDEEIDGWRERGISRIPDLTGDRRAVPR
jgi:prevent-host-death family protein